ncbi:MAG: 30S ribosomal protein S9 [Candidatus Yonathbacteria bacterium]|nr:30S ribosomal protein S9 [Candidatus Yonathbacteria bacterium]
MEHDTTTTNTPVEPHEDKELKTKTKHAVKKTASGRYISAIGRRKTSVARVRITESSKNSFSINEKELTAYFPTKELQIIVAEAFEKSKVPTKFHVEGRLYGGGIHSQAEALRHGISRALVAYDLELRKRLKKLGFLKRDPRMKERRKFGLKKARKAPQWSKR